MRALTLTFVFYCCVAQCFADNSFWKKISDKHSFTVVINPLNSNSILSGSIGGQVLISNNAGEDWSAYTLDAPSSSGVSSVLWSSADTNVILVGGFSFNGIWKSNDAGKTFARVLESGSESQWFVSDAIIEDPKNPTTLYACRFNINRYVYKSLNLGDTWDTLAVIPSILASQLCTITCRPDSTNILFIGAKGGKILRSIDSGKTWAATSVLRGGKPLTAGTEIPKIIFSKENPQQGYAVVFYASPLEAKQSGGLLTTLDGGNSWNVIALQDTSLWAVAEYSRANLPTQLFVGGFAVTPGVIGPGILASFENSTQIANPFESVVWGDNSQGLDDRDVWMFRQAQPDGNMYMGTSNGLFVLQTPTSVSESDADDHVTFRQTPQNVFVELTNTTQPAHWQLVSLQGVVYANGHTTMPFCEISLSSLPAGMYILNVRNNQLNESTKVIVVH